MSVCSLATSVILCRLERVNHGVKQAEHLEADHDLDQVEFDHGVTPLVPGQIKNLCRGRLELARRKERTSVLASYAGPRYNITRPRTARGRFRDSFQGFRRQL
jgi:hypothetical protein